ncbi:MAG: hypothetical protein A2W35_05370 [Chloroflexi bacterium RBG_16_57_11]|nr:MAG: hypothetical protein A2W35_05370 [Chloroflexi bacterium RBG_16_57_11]
MPGAPIKLTLYGPNDEIAGEHSRSFVPWKLLKRAIHLSKSFDAEEMSEEDLDSIAQLVVDFYGGQFSLEQLENGADAGEMMAVIEAIVAKAGQMSGANGADPNPPPQG